MKPRPLLDAHAEHRQQAGGDHLRRHALRFAGAGHGDVQWTERGHPGEGLGPVAPGVVVVAGHGHGRKLRRLFLQNDHVLRPLVGQRRQQHRVEDGEHRGVGTDPERERDDGGGRESWALDEAAEGEAEILHLSSVRCCVRGRRGTVLSRKSAPRAPATRGLGSSLVREPETGPAGCLTR